MGKLPQNHKGHRQSLQLSCQHGRNRLHNSSRRRSNARQHPNQHPHARSIKTKQSQTLPIQQFSMRIPNIPPNKPKRHRIKRRRRLPSRPRQLLRMGKTLHRKNVRSLPTRPQHGHPHTPLPQHIRTRRNIQRRKRKIPGSPMQKSSRSHKPRRNNNLGRRKTNPQLLLHRRRSRSHNKANGIKLQQTNKHRIRQTSNNRRTRQHDNQNIRETNNKKV